MAELTPMMQQYFEIKEQNRDCILFFRLGDFYEMFDEDARLASRVRGPSASRPRTPPWPRAWCGRRSSAW